MDFAYLSLLPVILVLFIAFFTRKVLPALLGGILLGVVILIYKEESFSYGIKCFTDVLSNGWSVKSFFFCFMIGAFVFIIEASGGVEGLVHDLTVKKQLVTSAWSAQLLAYLIGLLLFIVGISSIVVAGVASRPLFDKLNVSRHKLAYIVDSTASPVTWLFLVMEHVRSQMPYALISGLLPVIGYLMLGFMM